MGTILQIRTKFNFWESFSISQVLQCRKKPITQLFGKKMQKNDLQFFSRQDGVKDGHRSGKNQLLSNFRQILTMLLGVNKHASETKCTYFMAVKKKKYVNHEI